MNVLAQGITVVYKCFPPQVSSADFPVFSVMWMVFMNNETFPPQIFLLLCVERLVIANFSGSWTGKIALSALVFTHSNF